MKKSVLRAAIIACLPFCAMSLAIATTPAYAADKEAKPTVSRSISRLMVEAQKALEAKDYKTTIEKCEEAQKASDLTDYDKYLINRFLGVAYFGLGQRDKARQAFIAVVKDPATPTEDRAHLIGPAVGLAAEVNDNATVIELGKLAMKDNIANGEVYSRMAAAYYQTNDFQDAITYAQKGVDASVAEKKIPEYGLYQILAFSYDKLKDRPNEVKAFEKMARDYGKPDDWGYLLDFSLEILPQGNKTSREIAALDIYRLRMVVHSTWSPQNYLEAEDAARAIHSWGDARQVLLMGIDKGVINKQKIDHMLRQVEADAKKDEPALPQVEKIAKSGKDLTSVAEAYYGYERYDAAERVARKAIAAGGPTVAEATLVMAMSEVRQGNETAAKQTLANFQGDPPLTRAAQLWSLYLNRQYGQKQPAPAAPAAPAQ